MIEEKLAAVYRRWTYEVPGLRGPLGAELADALRSLLAGPDGPQIAEELGLADAVEWARKREERL